MPSKVELRRVMRDRLALSVEVRAEKSAAICRAIIGLPVWQRAHTVAMFAPQTREPDIDGLWSFAMGKRLAYPRTEGESMALFAIDSPAALQPSRWGLREPLPQHPVPPSEIDLVLVPGVAFGPTGARCGRGGGYYDRFLAALAPGVCKIGIGFDFQVVEEVPTEPHDHPMDLVVTDAGVLPCGRDPARR